MKMMIALIFVSLGILASISSAANAGYCDYEDPFVLAEDNG